MAYVKTNWVNDTTPINATNLNKIEDGIVGNETLIGDLTDLDTTNKTDVVQALNEAYSKEDEVDFTSQVTFNDVPPHAKFIKKGNMVFVMFQGSIKTHTSGEVLAIVPEAYRPSMDQQFGTFTINADSFGTVYMSNAGELRVNNVQSNAEGRIYTNFTYIID